MIRFNSIMFAGVLLASQFLLITEALKYLGLGFQSAHPPQKNRQLSGH